MPNEITNAAVDQRQLQFWYSRLNERCAEFSELQPYVDTECTLLEDGVDWSCVQTEALQSNETLVIERSSDVVVKFRTIVCDVTRHLDIYLDSGFGNRILPTYNKIRQTRHNRWSVVYIMYYFL